MLQLVNDISHLLSLNVSAIVTAEQTRPGGFPLHVQYQSKVNPFLSCSLEAIALQLQPTPLFQATEARGGNIINACFVGKEKSKAANVLSPLLNITHNSDYVWCLIAYHLRQKNSFILSRPPGSVKAFLIF